ncbi:MAG: hypothetical protein ACKVG4_12120 [Longimicrobiales bacterium]
MYGIPGRPTDPGPYAALGVYEGIRAALEHAYGTDSVMGRTVLIQGVGDVRGSLARLIRRGGGRVLYLRRVRARAFGLISLGDRDDEELLRRVSGIGHSLGEVFREATEKSESPMHAAMRRVKRVLQRGTVAQLPLSSLEDGLAENKEPRCAWRTGALFCLMHSDDQCITSVPG